MMPMQKQSADNGEAYQAGGNLTVTRGMDTSQMAEVMVAMAKHLQVHFSAAEAKLNERLSEFRESLISEFTKDENETGRESFNDPDFQFVINDAQKAFARDGSSDLKNELIRLLVQRSRHNTQDRLTKILNHSIELAASLGRQEYAALAINFLLTDFQLNTASFESMVKEYSNLIAPFYEDLSDNPTVYEYLEAQRCVTNNHALDRNLKVDLYVKYGSISCERFELEQLISIYPDGGLSPYAGFLLKTDHIERPYRFLNYSQTTVFNELKERGVPEDAVQRIMSLYRSKIPSGDRLLDMMSEEITGFSNVLRIWNSTLISKMTLTAFGKTIAHSALSSKASFNAPLSLWVQ